MVPPDHRRLVNLLRAMAEPGLSAAERETLRQQLGDVENHPDTAIAHWHYFRMLRDNRCLSQPAVTESQPV